MLIVAATDADSDDNGRVTYAITGGNEGTPFLIDNTEGRIRTNMKLDRETRDHYLLQVEAIDHVSGNYQEENFKELVHCQTKIFPVQYPHKYSCEWMSVCLE